MTSLHFKSACELVQLIRKKALSPTELMEQTLKRIQALNPDLNAFVCLREEEAMNEAKILTEKLAAGDDPGPLAGLPIGVKDLEDVAGMVTSYGSVPYKANLVHQDSVQVSRLKAAGAIVVGKTNTPEFGFTGFTKNRLFGVTRNPWNPDRTPGGSSGGSAAAITSGMVPLTTGSDAGGSIRIPACYCGAFGFKPSYGRIPLGPLSILRASRMWTLGPITRTVEDAALYMDAVVGYHSSDPDALPAPGLSYRTCLKQPLPPLKIAFSPTLGYARVQQDVMRPVEKALEVFRQMGHRVEIWEGKIPDGGQTWSDIMSYEIYTQVCQELEKNRAEMGRALVHFLDQAKAYNMEDHIRDQRVISELNRILWTLFDQYDLLLTPTMPTEAFAAKGPPPSEIDGHAVPLLGAVAFTYPFNLSGHPAATVRAGFTEKQLPAGLQIIGPRHRDDLVLQAAHGYEQSCPWNHHWPEI